jgi:cysteinyl-tRNA synthetase
MFQLYNTMARSITPFKPRNGKEVKMFTCGPSIYGRPHLGNYRTFLWEDVLQRYLEYLGYNVRRVMNLTDIEDKALAEAERIGTNVRDLTEANARHFQEECGLLRIAVPEWLPRSSTTVDQALGLIRILLEKGYAYAYRGDIYFDPLKFAGFGRLYGLDMSRWPKTKRRFKQDTYPGRRWNLGDFILWHGCGDLDTVCWDGEIGRGRPSWNIQDPAMIAKHLGYEIDIACGGIDNLYRHHDYNLAVIEAASGREFARHWMHCEHLLVSGKKMSKSLGNFIYPEDLIRDGFTGQQIRFYLIFGEHRVRQNYTRSQFVKAGAFLAELHSMLKALAPTDVNVSSRSEKKGKDSQVLTELFEQHMNDNLNVKAAFSSIHGALKQYVAFRDRGQVSGEDRRDIQRQLLRIDSVLQVLFAEKSA